MILILTGVGLILTGLFIFSARRDQYHSPFTAWLLSFLRIGALGTAAVLAVNGSVPLPSHSPDAVILADGSQWAMDHMPDEINRVAVDIERAGGSVSIGVYSPDARDDEKLSEAMRRPVSFFHRWDTALLWSHWLGSDRTFPAATALLTVSGLPRTGVSFDPELNVQWVRPQPPPAMPALAFLAPSEGLTRTDLPVRFSVNPQARDRYLFLYRDETLVDTVDLKPGGTEPLSGELERQISFDRAGAHVVRLHVTDELGDVSHRAISNISLAEKPSVFYVSLSAAKTPLRMVLEAEGYDTQHIPVSAMVSPGGDPFRNGEKGDLIILDSVPKEYLGSHAAGALTESVQRKGLSLLVIPDQIAEAPDGIYPVNRILPVRTGLDEDDEEDRTLAIVAVVDTSFSMYRQQDPGGPRKIEMARDALINLGAAMGNSDRFGVLGVDFTPFWVLYPSQDRNLASEMGRIRRMGAMSGGINLYSGLLAAFQELKKTDADIRHILVLLDTADVDEYEVMGTGSVWDLLRQFNEAGITISIVGIGGSGDEHIPFLNQYAEEAGGFLYIATDIHDVPGFFLEDLDQVSESPVLRRPMKTFFPSAEFPGVEKFPAVDGHVLVTPKPGSNLLSWSEPGYALLVSWRLGKGSVAVFTADSGSVLARQWMESEQGSLWNRIIAKIVQIPDGSATLYPTEVAGGVKLFLRLQESSVNQVLRSTVLHGPAGTAALSFQETWPGEYSAFLPHGQWTDAVIRISPGNETSDRERIYEGLSGGSSFPVLQQTEEIYIPETPRFHRFRETLSDPSVFRLVLLLGVFLFISESILRLL